MSIPFSLQTTSPAQPLCPTIPDRYPLTTSLLENYQSLLTEYEGELEREREKEVQKKLDAVFLEDVFEEEDEEEKEKRGRNRKLLRQVSESQRTIENVRWLLMNLHSPPSAPSCCSDLSEPNQPSTSASTVAAIINAPESNYASSYASSVLAPSTYATSSFPAPSSSYSASDKGTFESDSEGDTSSQPPSPAPTPNAVIPLSQDSLVGDYAELNAQVVDHKLLAFRQAEGTIRREIEGGFQPVGPVMKMAIESLALEKLRENAQELELEEETPMQTRRASPIQVPEEKPIAPKRNWWAFDSHQSDMWEERMSSSLGDW